MRLHLIIITIWVSLLLSSCSQKRVRPNQPRVVENIQVQENIQRENINTNKNSVTANIKAKLDSTKELQGFQIYPHIQDGKTLLSGIVNTKREKILAGSIARSVEGSGVVVNRLVVN
ncbi:MAG: BON domain-containing protein [Sulfurovum sp.]